LVRFHLVRPPVPVSTGKPAAWSRLNNAQRVALTAAASLRGNLAWACTSGCPNSTAVWVPIFRVARLTCQREIADAIAATPSSGNQVFYLQGHVCIVAIATTPFPFLQQKLSKFVSSQRPLLILDPLDFRVLQQLGVKFHQFHAERINGTEMAQSGYPRQDVVDTNFHRRRQPPFSSASVVKSGSTIAGSVARNAGGMVSSAIFRA
jgi:hypothetical protein